MSTGNNVSKTALRGPIVFEIFEIFLHVYYYFRKQNSSVSNTSHWSVKISKQKSKMSPRTSRKPAIIPLVPQD